MKKLTAILTVSLLVPLIAACGDRPQAQTQNVPMEVRQATVRQQISGSGTLQAVRESFLNFVTTGTVASVSIKEGDTVKQGTVLASLDTNDLDLQIKQAEANLKSAQANLEDLKNGPSESEIRTAQAQLEVAQIQLQQTKTGNATANSIESARANLRAAEAALKALRNPGPDELAAAELRVTEATNSLQATRNSSSSSKTQAEIALQQAVESLTRAQTNYSAAKNDWEFVQATGKSPNAGDNAAKLSDSQREQFYSSFVQAESSLRSAELTLQNAQVSFDNARQQEVLNVTNAENALAEAQRQLKLIQNPGERDIAQAEAQVASARSQLQQLTSGGSNSDVALAENTLKQRQAALEDLKVGPSDAQLAQADAAVAQAEASLAQAQRNRANAELVAPFDGIVAAVNITLGDSSTSNSSSNTNSSTAAIYLIDTSSYHVDMSISEIDLAKVEVGQKAQVMIDALPDTVFEGTLSYIAQTPTVEQNVTTYEAKVTLDTVVPQMRVGLNAAVMIVTAEKSDVVAVPNIAIRNGPQGSFVMLQQGEQEVPTPVELGIRGDSQTEVISGLKAGDTVLVSVTSNPNSNFGPGMGFPGMGPGGGGGAPGGGGGRPGGGGGAPAGPSR